MLNRAVQHVTVSLMGVILGCTPILSAPEEGAGNGARLRVVHASPDAPAVDVCANGAVVFDNASFPGATAYATVPAATYAVRVVPAGAGCDSAGVINAQLTPAAGTDTTVVALNTLNAIEPLVLSDDNAAPTAGKSKVRFVHASPNAPTVDVTLPDGTTLFNDISFKQNGGYIEVPAGTYTLQVRDQTGTSVVLSVGPVTLTSGKVYTVFAVGLAGGNPPLDALLTVDN
ncbi:MAG: DUF4397 domain-containing protein [Phycisphaerae bacterium]